MFAVREDVHHHVRMPYKAASVSVLDISPTNCRRYFISICQPPVSFPLTSNVVNDELLATCGLYCEAPSVSLFHVPLALYLKLDLVKETV